MWRSIDVSEKDGGVMRVSRLLFSLSFVFVLFSAAPAQAEILAFVTYETRSEESLRALKLKIDLGPKENGVAVIDLDPASTNYGKILAEYPFPDGTSPHHQFYNPDKTKLYVTATVKQIIHVLDLTRQPYRVKRIDAPGCDRIDSMAFSETGDTWWATCIRTSKILVGDGNADKVVRVIDVGEAVPHGIAIRPEIDRLLVTDLGQPTVGWRDSMLEIEASTGRILASRKLSGSTLGHGSAPALIRFSAKHDPPLAYITAMLGGADKKGNLWIALWDKTSKRFEYEPVFDFRVTEGAIPLALKFTRSEKRLLVASASPGFLHIFDVATDPLRPRILATLPAGIGAHHIAITPDDKMAFVQNGVLNAPGFSHGGITVFDLEKLSVIDTIDTFPDRNLTTFHILLLPQWD